MTSIEISKLRQLGLADVVDVEFELFWNKFWTNEKKISGIKPKLRER